MREVAVVGIGQTKVEEHWDKSLLEIAGEAVFLALQDASIERVDSIYVGNMMSGSANRQQHLGSYLADWVGMRFAAGYHIEAACSSGAAAFRAAIMAVASGSIDTAVAIGVEKMTDSPGAEITTQLSTASDTDWEADMGLSFVALNALIMQRYIHEYHWQKDDFAGFSINAHANGAHNPYARFQSPISQSSYQKAAIIADPINLMDASPMGDGSAAAIIVPLEWVKTRKWNKAVKVVASTAATDTMATHSRKDPIWLAAAESSSIQAYKQAGIKPADIGVFELHDAFTIMATLSLEACGFMQRGQGPRAAIENQICPKGRIPIATRGGLKARGHPVGATGMYQVVEVIQQLRGEAGETQVERPLYGMTQNIGGSGSNIITHIFKAL